MTAMTTTPTACEMRSLATTRSVCAPAIVLMEDQPTQAMLQDGRCSGQRTTAGAQDGARRKTHQLRRATIWSAGGSERRKGASQPMRKRARPEGAQQERTLAPCHPHE